MKSLRFALLIFFIGILILACTGLSATASATITLNSQITYQKITGWEAVAQIGQTDFPNSQVQMWKDQVINQAVNDLGINRLRLPIRSGTENPVDYFAQYMSGAQARSVWQQHWYDIVNDNSDPNTIDPSRFQFSELDLEIEDVALPMKQLLEAKGEHLYLNVTYVDFKTTSDLHYNHPDEYAEFVLATYQHMQSKYGFVPDSWEMILEPDNSAWTGTEIGKAVAATAARLKAAGFTPKFVLPSTTNMSDALPYFNDAVAVPGVLPYVAELSYHRYSGVSDGTLQSIETQAAQLGLNTAMLEHIGSGYQDLYKDLSMGGNSAWEQFTLAYPTKDNGAQYYWIDNSNPASPVVHLSTTAKFLRQYFKFIRAGAVRFQATSSNASFQPLAFVNPKGDDVVVVNAGQGGEISINGLNAGTYGIKYTTGSQYDVDLPDVTVASGQSLTTRIPAAGVITIYGKSSSPTVTPTPPPANWNRIYIPSIVWSSTTLLQPTKSDYSIRTGGGCTSGSIQTSLNQ
jgi:hypothetical protein